ncbi:EAL domain-containing protein [Nocardioides sp. W7]|uniref:putative bifunctional diguanylate cyclase/phosphodiesterase n=1 Tax=Nocardioides sp. W7 TaxID=2931390 RepID=UPI001FD51AA1|nr:EAL domain-containing protein [Nocardioides sp. W7]
MTTKPFTTPQSETARVPDGEPLPTERRGTIRGRRRQRRQEQFFQSVSQRSNDLAVVLDQAGLIVYVSPSLTSMLGYGVVEVLGADGITFVHPDDHHGLEACLHNVASGGGASAMLRLRDRTGSWRWFEGVISNMFDSPVGGLVFNLRDVTDRVAAERAVRASEELHRAIADRSTEGMWVVLADGTTRYANDRLTDILGIDPSDLDTALLTQLLGGVPVPLRSAGRDGAGDVPRARREATYRHPDATERVLRVAVTTIEHVAGVGGPAFLVLVDDVTEARRLELQMQRTALQDNLTGLPNQALLLDRLQRALARNPAGTAAIFVDLDDFAVFNDACGHAVGDQLLVAVAERLRDCVPSTDTVARFNGDSFAFVCEPADEVRATALATAVATALHQPFRIADHVLHVTASIGVAVSPAPSAPHLLRHAGAAMRAAKASGPGNVRISDAELTSQAQEAFEIGSDLHQALIDESLHLHYQPVIDLSTGLVVGVEALARWEHPTHGSIPPSRFVAVAERTGIAPDLDRWAVRTALSDTHCMRQLGALARSAYVAVNLSARSLTSPGMESYLIACAGSSGIDPSEIVLEVTEGSVMTAPEAARAMLARLREHGFQVALDDFGTGHSSLAYLRDLPISMLKIDRSFVAGIADNRQDLAIAKMIVHLAQTVGVTVVAEGVETVAHARQLSQMECASGQGWLWSPAISLAQAVESGALIGSYGGWQSRRRRTG